MIYSEVAEIVCPAVTGVRRIRLLVGGGVTIYIYYIKNVYTIVFFLYLRWMSGCTTFDISNIDMENDLGRGDAWMVVLANSFKIFYAINTIGR